MSKFVIFGNSGSGKSTLAKELVLKHNLSHLDLDNIAWRQISPPERMPISDSEKLINDFLTSNKRWVIEGCYSDLLELVIPMASDVVFLNLPINECINNAKRRPWEQHKYESKEKQDANLKMLVDWISMYDTREDTFSKVAHQKLFDSFQGKKLMFNSNDRRS